MGKLNFQQEKITKSPEKGSSIKLVLNKNFEFKEKDKDKEDRQSEPMFKNNYLKGLSKDAKDDNRSDRKMNDFLIRKKVPYHDEKNSVNLFNSVLSSLRKDRK